MARKRAWTFQDKRQVEKHGTKAGWCVGWVDPNGTRKQKSCGSGTRDRKLAERVADQLHSQLITGTYESEERKSWGTFGRSMMSELST